MAVSGLGGGMPLHQGPEMQHKHDHKAEEQKEPAKKDQFDVK